MYDQLKKIVDEIKPPQNSNHIRKRTKELMDTFREHIFMTIVDDKVYVIKRGKLDIFNKNEVTIEYDNEEIKYLEPHMVHSRRCINNPDSIKDIMESINMTREDKLRYERYLFEHA